MEKPIATILYSEVTFKWIKDYYDLPLSGTCIYKNNLCRFECSYSDWDEEDEEWEEKYNIYALSFWDKIKWIYWQKKFELCVGYHWSYPHRKQGARFYYRKPKWLFVFLFNLFYRKQRREQIKNK